VRQEAAWRRQTVAHGVSRGSGRFYVPSRLAAREPNPSPKASHLAPSNSIVKDHPGATMRQNPFLHFRSRSQPSTLISQLIRVFPPSFRLLTAHHLQLTFLGHPPAQPTTNAKSISSFCQLSILHFEFILLNWPHRQILGKNPCGKRDRPPPDLGRMPVAIVEGRTINPQLM
jgi:hypothetical protein